MKVQARIALVKFFLYLAIFSFKFCILQWYLILCSGIWTFSCWCRKSLFFPSVYVCFVLYWFFHCWCESWSHPPLLTSLTISLLKSSVTPCRLSLFYWCLSDVYNTIFYCSSIFTFLYWDIIPHWQLSSLGSFAMHLGLYRYLERFIWKNMIRKRHTS